MPASRTIPISTKAERLNFKPSAYFFQKEHLSGNQKIIFSRSTSYIFFHFRKDRGRLDIPLPP